MPLAKGRKVQQFFIPLARGYVFIEHLWFNAVFIGNLTFGMKKSQNVFYYNEGYSPIWKLCCLLASAAVSCVCFITLLESLVHFLGT